MVNLFLTLIQVDLFKIIFDFSCTGANKYTRSFQKFNLKLNNKGLEKIVLVHQQYHFSKKKKKTYHCTIKPSDGINLHEKVYSQTSLSIKFVLEPTPKTLKTLKS